METTGFYVMIQKDGVVLQREDRQEFLNLVAEWFHEIMPTKRLSGIIFNEVDEDMLNAGFKFSRTRTHRKG